MDTEHGRVGKPTGLSQAEPEVSALTGFDPSRDGLGYLARAVWLAGTTLRDKEAIWESLSDGDRWPYFRSAIAVVEALHELGRKNERGWCPIAARAAQVEIDRALWALGQKSRPLHDEELFIACLAPFLASAIEARRAETHASYSCTVANCFLCIREAGGSVADESATRQGDAQC